MTVPIITIDGPAGVGKGTAAVRLARRLSFRVLDSGSIYRALAYAAITHDIAQTDEQALCRLAHRLDVRYENVSGADAIRTVLNDCDISEAIRSEDIGLMSARIATVETVRTALLARQRAFAVSPGLVADGRDMGTVVFPNALVKFFLTATPECRARRRVAQLRLPDDATTIARFVRMMTSRDRQDTGRIHAPLRPAEDAVVIDTTALSRDQVVHRMHDCVRTALSAQKTASIE